ncbi:MAG: tetratricopeptide repeat protein, partial [Candidatus Electrothrix sp. AR5]|nr:tetratricopeptide repeat protein [Candidatus Electrothrix sp. AR5]
MEQKTHLIEYMLDPMFQASFGLFFFLFIARKIRNHPSTRHLSLFDAKLLALVLISWTRVNKVIWVPPPNFSWIHNVIEILMPGLIFVNIVIITEGISAGRAYRKGMRRHTKEMKQKQQELAEQTLLETKAESQEIRLVSAQIKAVQAYLAEPEQHWEAEHFRRLDATTVLKKMSGQVPGKSIRRARKALQQGKREQAREVFAQIRKHGGEDAPQAAYHEGQLAEGMMHFDEALELYQAALDCDENNTEYLLFAGAMACRLNQFSQAQEWLEQRLAIQEAEKTYIGQLADTRNTLANIYLQQGEYQRAESLQQQALVDTKKAVGEHHPIATQCLANLATIHQKQKKYVEAEQLYRTALFTARMRIGSKNLAKGILLDELATLYAEQENYKKAERCSQKALAVI